MAFKTKLDFSNNRQVKQNVETLTVLSGATSFGVPFDKLPTGPNLSTSAETQSFNGVISTFSGNNTTTIYNWYDSRMEAGIGALTALTPSISGVTQDVPPSFSANTTGIVDGNIVVLDYFGVEFNVTPIGMIDLGGGNYSGSVLSTFLTIYSADTTDFTGRTIWVDVSGITRTEDLIISKNAGIGKYWTCSDLEGKGEWSDLIIPPDTNTFVTGGTYSSGTAIFTNNLGNTFNVTGFYTGGTGGIDLWVSGTGLNSLTTYNGSNTSSGDYAISEGNQTDASGIVSHAEGYNTTASGNYSHAEGQNTIASGGTSHAEGNGSIAGGLYSHAQGGGTKSLGAYSHAEGNGSFAIGNVSHAEGNITTANGNYSHTGGYFTVANGTYSFVHGSESVANGDNTIVFGANITGNTPNTMYVDNLNIKTVGTGPGATDIGIDANGNVVNQASDVRLKENVSTIENALDKVRNLRGVKYQWIDKENGGDNYRIGFIAQEVNAVEPLLTFVDNSEEQFMGVQYKDVSALLVEAIKELASGSTTSNNTALETQTILAEDNNIDLNYNGTPETALGGGITVLHAKGDNLSSELLTDENGDWLTNNDFKPKALTIPVYTPTSSEDINGNEGNITRDDNYMYIKTINGWKRTNLESF